MISTMKIPVHQAPIHLPIHQTVHSPIDKFDKIDHQTELSYTSTVENSLGWKFWHGTNYMLGGIFFIVGSLCYYPFMYNDVKGGWLFTFGSLFFLFADLTEWNHYKLGCLYQPAEDVENYERFTFYQKFKRAEIGFNFSLSATGSLLYLIGSVMFIPETKLLVAGEWIFIIGSFIIFFNQMWKCYRTATTNELNLYDKSFSLNNILVDFAGFNVDLFAGLGGLMYAVGTILFMKVVTNEQLTVATHWFMAGAIFFSLSGIFMQYRYFCSQQAYQIHQ